MRCQNCGTELEEGSKFCRECGSKVIENKRFCRECGTELPEGAKFCPECGANILPKSSVASPPGGHRTASNNSFNEGINVKPSKGQKRSKRRII